MFFLQFTKTEISIQVNISLNILEELFVSFSKKMKNRAQK